MQKWPKKRIPYQGRTVYRVDWGDALPTGRKRIIFFFLFYHGKSSFQCSRPIICHCPIRIVRFKSRFKWSRLYGRIHRRGKSPKPSPLTLMLKLFFSEIEPSMHFQWGFGTRPNVLASYVTEQRARRDIFDQVTC